MELEAIRIVQIGDNNNLVLNANVLENILSQPDIQDRAISVISIAGAIRKGKSFILNFFLRYLKATYTNNSSNAQNWIGSENDPLTGFSWRGGSERNTVGVLVWPEIFLHDYSNGKKIAILIIDTQGTFDSKTTLDGNVSIFALSTMLSSLQIYNVSNNIQEDQLQYLQLFAEYGKQALVNPLNKPFQKLLFLVRDWNYPYESPYGYVGGRAVLQNALRADPDEEENQELRDNIKASFEQLDCYLMPYPGRTVATSQNFQGKIKDIDRDFVNSLKEFVPSILGPPNLITKKVNGVEITAQEFLTYLRSYVKVLTGNTLPNPKNILSATAEAQNLSAIERAKQLYQQNMESAVRNANHYYSFGEIAEMHRKNNEKAVQKYNETPKIQSTDKTADDYELELESGLKKNLNYYLIRNEKNRPDLNPKVDELINAITREKSVSDNLNAENTKLILDMINTMNTSLAEYRNEVNQLIEAFNASKDDGMDTMSQIKEFISLIPHIIGIFALF